MNSIKILTGLMVGAAMVASAGADEIPAGRGEGREQPREVRSRENGGRQMRPGREWRGREAITGPQCLVLVIDTSAAAPKAFQRTVRMATMAVERLKETDTVSIVTFDEVAETVLPATSAKEKQKIRDAIKALKPKGEKALMAGLARGAEEVRKASEGQAKRLMLLSSPAPATIGPGAPEDLRKFSESLRKEGIRFNGGMHMMGPFGENGRRPFFGRPGQEGPGARPGREGRDGERRLRPGRNGRKGGRRGGRDTAAPAEERPADNA